MARSLYILANFFGGLVLILLLVDPTRPLTPIFVLLFLGVVCAILPRLCDDEPGLTFGEEGKRCPHQVRHRSKWCGHTQSLAIDCLWMEYVEQSLKTRSASTS
jgi:hypothetical protein